MSAPIALRSAARASLARGFTMIEALVVLSITAVLLAIVIPSFQSAFLSNKLASYANAWIAAVHLARGEAVKRNLPTVLCRSSDGDTCASGGTWQAGWIVCVDADKNGSCAASETKVWKQESLSSDYHFTPNCLIATCSGTGYALTFQPAGINPDLAQWKLILCRATPSAGGQERELTVKATGSTNVATTKNGSCA